MSDLDLYKPQKRGRGAPPGSHSKYTPAVVEAICNNLRIAMPLGLAAEAEGISQATASTWMKEKPDFAEAVTRARAEGVKCLTVHALRGGKGSSQAAWFLERRYRAEYGPPKEAKTDDEATVITIEGGLPPFPQ